MAWVTLWLLLALAAPAAAADWSFDFLMGGAWNARSDVTIRQGGEPDLDFGGDFSTRPLDQPWYWAVRLGLERGDRAWSLELHHHKLYLDNPPADVQLFHLTHGANIVTLQHSWLRERWRYGLLAGIMIAHPENTVRWQKRPEPAGLFDGGYELAGPVVGINVGGELPLTDWLAVTAEGRATVSWIDVDVVDGNATFTSSSLHLLLGPRLRF